MIRPEYYEWVGYSWWGGDKDGQRSILPGKLKPVFIAEATPRGHFFDKEIQTRCGNGLRSFLLTWKRISMWFVLLHISTPIGTQTCGMVKETRIETVPSIKTRWFENASPRYVNAADKPFELIGLLKNSTPVTRLLVSLKILL